MAFQGISLGANREPLQLHVRLSALEDGAAKASTIFQMPRLWGGRKRRDGDGDGDTIVFAGPGRPGPILLMLHIQVLHPPPARKLYVATMLSVLEAFWPSICRRG